MNISVFVASAFSKDHEGGNKAGVVFLTDPLTREQKIQVAHTLGYSETSFISDSKVADYRFEYFTPTEEVDLCGHATIASFVILKHLNQLTKSDYTIETNVGILSITVNDDTIFMEQTAPAFTNVIPKETFEHCFDISKIDNHYDIQIVSTGLEDILIPIESKSSLDALQPNFEQIKKVSSDYNVVGFHLYTQTDDQIICRNFAPLYDIDEESATGTSNGALACFLYKNSEAKKLSYVFNQGYSLDLVSEILVTLEANVNDDIEKVFVGGKGYFVSKKELEI